MDPYYYQTFRVGIYTFNPGTYTIKLVLDPDNLIQESVETNNTYTYTLTIKGPTGWFMDTYWGQDTEIGNTGITVNEYAPIDPQTGKRCITGCTNTAIAQMLHCFAGQGYDFTIDLTAEDAFQSGTSIWIDGTAENAKKNGNLSFEEINALLEDYNPNSAEDIAALCYASAVIAESSFGSRETSTAMTENVFLRAGFKSAATSYEGYSPYWAADGNLSDAGWEMIKSNMNNKRPILVSIPKPAHAVVIDGYDAASDRVHINFGWGFGGAKCYNNSYGIYTGSGWYSRQECDILNFRTLISDITPDTIAPTASGDISCRYNGKYADLELDFTDDVGVWKKYYRIAGGSEWKEYTDTVRINSNATVHFRALDRAKNISAEAKYTVCITTPNLQGTADGISWDNIPDVSGYLVEYSRDHFKNVIRFESSGNKVDIFALPAGDCQWRVKALGRDFAEKELSVPAEADKIQHFVSDADGNMDVFFANANGVWEDGFSAQHLGIKDVWNGTGQKVVLSGKNKLADIFEGSSDANILLMTDDLNGDALFVDDIYTALPGTDTDPLARIARINQIRAGAGDDIVDMTSQEFSYVGNGIQISGGLGNDTIWVNNGNNILFGDAGNDNLAGGSGNDYLVGGIGNDIMYGGGGDDIFTFGGNWGTDRVEQISGGKVTLWFQTGSVENWDSQSLTYTDGENSVTVSGISGVTLKFGTDSALPAGVFADAVSKNIFEDSNQGLLA